MLKIRMPLRFPEILLNLSHITNFIHYGKESYNTYVVSIPSIHLQYLLIFQLILYCLSASLKYNEFCYKFNRKYFWEAIFNRLLVTCVSYKNTFGYEYR